MAKLIHVGTPSVEETATLHDVGRVPAFGAPPSSEGEYPRFRGPGIEGDALRARSDVSLQSSGLTLRVGRLQRRVRIRVIDGGPVLSHADRVTRAPLVPTRHTQNRSRETHRVRQISFCEFFK